MKESQGDSKKIFCGKKALVVGGSGGIGAEISLLLAENGADLVIHGAHNGEKLNSLSEKIQKITGKNPEVIIYDFFKNDFNDFDKSPLFSQAKNCDILILAFGPFLQKSLDQTSLEDWKNLSLLNYALPGSLLSRSLPHMCKNAWGRILLFGGTGTSFRREFSTNAAYAGAKAGLNVLVNSVALEYAQFGINCNLICPGFTKTEYISDQAEKVMAEKMPSKKMISAKRVAESALFLLKNADINGETLRLDCGWSPVKNAK